MQAWKFTFGNRWTTIAAESWFDARAHARVVLGSDEITWESAEARDAHTVLRWEGSDFGGVRKMTVEERT